MLFSPEKLSPQKTKSYVQLSASLASKIGYPLWLARFAYSRRFQWPNDRSGQRSFLPERRRAVAPHIQLVQSSVGHRIQFRQTACAHLCANRTIFERPPQRSEYSQLLGGSPLPTGVLSQRCFSSIYRSALLGA